MLLIIDEAQDLLPETLEQIRLLSNLETETTKLIQILLLGQPELDAMLESPDLRQLRQRIGVRWRLAPLSRDETSSYVRHRLRVSADAERDHIFGDAALARGVPLLGRHSAPREPASAIARCSPPSARAQPQIGADAVRRAAIELRGDGAAAQRAASRRAWPAVTAMALATAVALLFAFGGPRAVGQRLGLIPADPPPVAVATQPEPVAQPAPDVAMAPPASAVVVSAPVARARCRSGDSAHRRSGRRARAALAGRHRRDGLHRDPARVVAARR